MTRQIKKLLVANRGEIAIRIFRACAELGIRTVGIYSRQDHLSLFRYKADEAYLVGEDKSAVGAYLDIEGIIKIAVENDVDAIHPGYGFLSENAEFAQKVMDAGLIWIGPSPKAMALLGDKVKARQKAIASGVPVVPGSEGALEDFNQVQKVADEIGFPLLLKSAAGGGGRGMAVVRQAQDLKNEWERCRRESLKAFGNNDIFVERYVDQPKHIEVQILGDQQGNVIHLFERDCSVQRRFQKVVELAPCRALDDSQREALFEASLKLAKAVGYSNAGTCEFLCETQGPNRGQFYFIEANARLQVEHTVTEWVTGIDLVQSQIHIASGRSLKDLKLDNQENISCHGYAIQCRINAEDPSHDFTPQVGRITTWRSAAGMGVRLDSGGGDVNFEIGADYDSLLCKLSTWAPSFAGANRKMNRALREFRIRGVRTNIPFLLNVIAHPLFESGDINTSFVDECSELFQFPPRLDRANKLLYYLGHTTLHRSAPPLHATPAPPPPAPASQGLGSRELFQKLGKEKFLEQIRSDDKLWLTDTTLRDAHQSLLATRMRTIDMLPALPCLNALPFFSLEVWGGATYDVAYRFLQECPWERLEKIRELAPRVLLQMLLRGSNVVGYKNQPDNLIQHFVKDAVRSGIDLFRIFDALNYVPNLKVSLDSVKEEGALAEMCLCYTGDVANPNLKEYPLSYYVDLAGEMHSMGADLIAIKDMAGLLTPQAAALLISKLREAVPCPIHLHTHDTSSMQGATLLTAAEHGVDIVDVASGPLSGLTSQPNMESLIANLKLSPRHTGLNNEDLRPLEFYWQKVRELYQEFESGLKAGSAGVYWHEIPGGQYSNLLPQAKALGLEERWGEVLDKFHQANQLMGNPPKVTPSSKAVGDLAMMMVNQNLNADDVKADPQALNWPASVVDFFKGMMGQPPHAFDQDLQKAVLGDDTPYQDRAGQYLEAIDFEQTGHELNELLGRSATSTETLSHILFPGPFRDFCKHRHRFGDTSILDTDLFFHGLDLGHEVQIEIERGKTLFIKLVAIEEPNERGERAFHFEMNGLPRTLMVRDLNLEQSGKIRRQADDSRPNEIGAPMPGTLSQILVHAGEQVESGQTLFVMEAMKMETKINAPQAGTVKELVLPEGEQVEKNDLVLVLEINN